VTTDGPAAKAAAGAASRTRMARTTDLMGGGFPIGANAAFGLKAAGPSQIQFLQV
jgi:hypothetical protein